MAATEYYFLHWKVLCIKSLSCFSRLTAKNWEVEFISVSDIWEAVTTEFSGVPHLHQSPLVCRKPVEREKTDFSTVSGCTFKVVLWGWKLLTLTQTLYIHNVSVHVRCSELLQHSLVNTVVIDDLNLQLKVVRRASLGQTLGLQVDMMDNLKEPSTNYKKMIRTDCWVFFI